MEPADRKLRSEEPRATHRPGHIEFPTGSVVYRGPEGSLLPHMVVRRKCDCLCEIYVRTAGPLYGPLYGPDWLGFD